MMQHQLLESVLLSLSNTFFINDRTYDYYDHLISYESKNDMGYFYS